MKKKGFFVLLVAFLVLGVSIGKCWAINGIIRDGIGARSIGMGGATTAKPYDALSCFFSNPAGIAAVEGGRVDFSTMLAFPRVEYTNQYNNTVPGTDQMLTLPAFGAVYKDPESIIGLGFAAYTYSGLEFKYKLNDVTFGSEKYTSLISNFRFTPAMGFKISDNLYLGGGFTIAYNEFDMALPYTIQTGGLRGTKVLMDMETDGYSYGGVFGLLYHPSDELSIGFSYTMNMEANMHGSTPLTMANGLVGRYNVGLKLEMPSRYALGIAWDPSELYSLSLDVSYIDWSKAFDTLNLNLGDGTNATVNAIAGGPSIQDQLNLDWHDRFVLHVGCEFFPAENWTLRGGYIYGESPVPESTMLPILAPILEHNITCGVGYEWNPWEFNIAYQACFTNKQNVGPSHVFGNDFDSSEVKLNAHVISATISMFF